MDRITFMQAYCRVVETGSISATARELGLSASMISRALKATEQGLGTTLLNRNTRTIATTEDGQFYYEECKRLTGDLAALDARLRSGRNNPAGKLRINAPLSFGIKVLGPAIPAFRARYPDIQIALNLEDRVIDMVSGGYDISLRVRQSLPDSSLRARKLGITRQVLCAAPAYLARHPAIRHPDDLHQHDLISFSLHEPAGVWPFRKGRQYAETDIRNDLAVNNSLFIADMLAAGQGVGSLPLFVAQSFLDKGDLVEVMPDWRLDDRHVYAVTASQTGNEARVRVFVDFVESLLKNT